MPDLIEPMKAKLAAVPAISDEWATEIKWDGVRAIAFCDGGRLFLQGRRLNDITDLFPEIRELANAPGADGTVLDGELVAFDSNGIPDFRRIQARLEPQGRHRATRPARSYRATFVIFDLLWEKGGDLRDRTYTERRERLEALGLNGRAWQTPDYLVADIASTLEATTEQGLEGLVVKRLDSLYRGGGRGQEWLKLKKVHRQEFVVGGWLPAASPRGEAIDSLLLGYWDSQDGRGEHLMYAGQVKSGFALGDLEAIEDDLEGYARDTPPFEDMERVPGAHFVNPIRVIEVEFNQWGDDNHLLRPVFTGMRRDKDPGEVRRERPVDPD